jgi:hypothetical protein
MPLVGFESTIPVFERMKTVHVLDRAATVSGDAVVKSEIITMLLNKHIYIEFFFNGSCSPFWALAAFQFGNHFSQTVGLLGRVISPSQGCYLNTIQTQNKRMHTPNIHVLSWIRTHDPSVRASKDNSCLRPLDYCDRPFK